MRNFDNYIDYESRERPLSDQFMDFVIDHIENYREPRALGASVESVYSIDTAWQVIPIKDLKFRVQNNDDMELSNIHQRYYSIEMFMQNGEHPSLPMKLTLVDGENAPGIFNFYFQVDDEVEVPASDELVEQIMATIDDFDIPKFV